MFTVFKEALRAFSTGGVDPRTPSLRLCRHSAFGGNTSEARLPFYGAPAGEHAVQVSGGGGAAGAAAADSRKAKGSRRTVDLLLIGPPKVPGKNERRRPVFQALRLLVASLLTS